MSPYLKLSTLICSVLLLIATPALAAPQSAEPTDVERQVFDYMGYGEATVIRLWPEGSERNKSSNGEAESGKLTDKLRITNLGNTSLLVYPPPAGVPRLDTAVIHCPGGGYRYLAMANPKQFVEWMHQLGVTVAVLKYHTPRSKDDPKHLIPLADGQRALRVLRHHAESFGLDPDKIGIAGSSAGGHLAFNTCLMHESPVYEAIDEIDKLSCRPAYGMLFYPAYLAKDRNSIDGHANLEWDRIEKGKTPPIFMTINGDDRNFVLGNLGAMSMLGKKKVPSELHVWTQGGHGGCFDKYPLAEFARPAARFLARHDIMPKQLVKTSDDWLDPVVGQLRKHVEPTVVEAPKPPKGLADDELSEIDRAVRKAAGQTLPVYRIWPGDGTRSDDPFKAETETLREAKNSGVAIASDVTAPTMTFFPADKPTGRSVLVFPGGGYGVLAWGHEGVKVAQWLNEQGIHAFLVKYRTPRRKGLEKHAVALQDAHRAMRLVRGQAEAFGISPDKIGVLGFSAGGHLAALTSTEQDKPSYPAIDELDSVSPLPDFNILIYPAYTADKAGQVDPLLLQEKTGSPTFIATAADDRFTLEQYHFVQSRLKTKTPVAFHVYETGAHGKGILPGPYAFSQWPRECARWLEDLDN
jgi:acetyl esterase/lipase